MHTVTVAEPQVSDGDLSTEEAEFLLFREGDTERNGGYSHEQRTRPLTLAHALNDSPAGLAAWIVEKFRDWGDCGRDVEARFRRDTLVSTVAIYWLTQTIASSFRFYYEWKLGSPGHPMAWSEVATVAAGVDSRPLPQGVRIEVPVAVALFGHHCPRSWAERCYGNLARWTEMPRGGHFPALEEPDLLAQDVLDTVARFHR
jgi:pimeloyl-ACP methyl ester carboxylesterase